MVTDVDLKDCPCYKKGVNMSRHNERRVTQSRIATGFDLEPLPDGDVRIEFYGDDGQTFNSQVVPADVLRNMPLVASLTEIALREGPAAVQEIMVKLNEHQGGAR